jgi:hypothetical protein
VCPYSYLLAHEGEEAEDEGLVEVEWLPFKLRPAPAALPEPRGGARVRTPGAAPEKGEGGNHGG